jgi:hypothetical protein
MSPIPDLLKDISMTQTLKDLTICIKSSRSNLTDADWRDFVNPYVWKDMDLVLSSISTLQEVSIHLYFGRYRTIPTWIWERILQSMPLLEERQILTLKANEDAYTERHLMTEDDTNQ